jgi:singapore isolate B (sub-type 7) whole genome shotgun sequence assembly, scaffold_7
MTEYLQPTRLESMMQDYPKLMRVYRESLKITNSHLIITYPREIAWSPVKNSLSRGRELEKKTGHAESAASGEHDLLNTYRLLLMSVNECPVCNPSHVPRVTVEEGAYVVFGPEAGCTTEEIHSHLGSDILLKKGSVLIVNCRNWYLDKVIVDGTLILDDDSGEEIQTARIELRNCVIQNMGWSYKTIDPENACYSPIYQMRGFIVERRETCTLCCGKNGDCIHFNRKVHN